MTVSEYLEFVELTSETDGKIEVNEFELGKIFHLDPKDFSTIDEYHRVIETRTKVREDYVLPPGGEITLKDKQWYWDTDISKTNVEQWCIVSEEISRELSINPKLIAIYFRPVGETFNSERLEWITNEIMEMDISIFLALNKVFFYQGMKLLSSTRVLYLNQLQHPSPVRQWIKEKSQELIRYGKVMVGIYKQKN